MKPTDIQKHIINVTRELLKKNPDVTIKNIADASYVNIASVNYYFGSKNQLFKIVCEDFVNEVKNGLLKLMFEREEGQTEVLLKNIISFLYERIMENAGIMNYILQNLGNKQGDMLLKTFFSENEFTEKMFELFQKQTDIQDKERLFARYTILFASFIFPLFIKLSDTHADQNKYIVDEMFGEMFIKELAFIIRHNPNKEHKE